MKKHILNILLVLFVLNVHLVVAQESNVSINGDGKDYTKLKHTWIAQWITHPTESTLDANTFLFRKNFELQDIPEKFIIYVSADNRYKLFVNGKYVGSGPSSGDINHYRYETLDISSFLNKGKNIISAQVVNFGEYKKVSTISVQTAFILQNENQDLVNLNTGRDTDWKVTCDHGFEIIAFPVSNDYVKGYYAAGPGEKLISENHPWGWKDVRFDDKNWLKPKIATTEFAVGRGFLYGSTWHLVKRVIPPLEQTNIKFAKVVRSEGINVSKEFLSGKEALLVPANKKVQLLFDQEYHTIGHPILHFSGGKGSEIKLTYAEALYDKDGKKGNRNLIEGKTILGYYDKVIADGGKNREFQPIGQKTYRYVQMDITTGDMPLIINDFHGVYTAYPFKENAYFHTDNKMLSEIWDNSWRTLRNSAVEAFIDPYYEQLQYIGDTKIEAMVSIAVSGDDRLMRKAIKMFDNSRLPIGLTASRYPSCVLQVIPPYSLLWIDMLYDYHMYRDDDTFIEQFLPGADAVLLWWIRKIDDFGMPTHMEWWNFTDWAEGYPNGIPPGADDGYSATIALQLVMALQNVITIYEDLGNMEKANFYRRIEKRIRKSVKKNCFDVSKKLFAETPDKQIFSQHTNILAVLTNTIARGEQKQLMNRILDDKELIQTTIYFKYYLFEALDKVGLGNRYVELLKPWKNQIKQGLTTFAETDEEPRSDCHAWSSSPNYHFLKIIAGIAPASKNFKTIRIAPNFNGLNHVDAVMPHPNGEIKVHLIKDGNTINGEIELPKGNSGVFYWNNKAIKLSPGKQNIEVE